MTAITDDAVCIRRWDFSETSQTLSLFCRDHGVVRGLAKGAKRAKGAFAGGIDLLTRGQVTAIIKPGLELATLTSWHLVDLYRPVRQHLAANRAAIYMADLVHHMLTAQDPHPQLFDEFTSALASFTGAGESSSTLLRFQWSVLKETGYQPQLDRDARTGEPLPAITGGGGGGKTGGGGGTIGFSAAAGGTIAEIGAEPAGQAWRVRRETIELLRKLAAGETSEGAQPTVQDRANRLLASYLRQIMGEEPPSMRWAFPDLS